MKKIFYLFSFFVFCALPISASAATFEGTDVFILEEGEVVSDDLFIGAERVQIKGTVNGDLFVGATIIDISGDVSGSVFAGGSEVVISGDIGNDLFLGSGTTRLSGSVGDNVYAGTGILTTSKEFSTGADLIFGAGDASIDGLVGKNLVTGGGALSILGDVNGSAYLSVGDENNSSQSGRITIGRDAEIAGNLEYESPEEADIDDQAIIGGAIDYSPVSEASSSSMPQVNLGFDFSGPFIMFISWLWNFIIALIVAFVFAAVYTKEKIKNIDILARSEMGKVFGYGALATFGAPLLLLVIAMTIIGLPFAFVLGLIYVILVYAATSLISIMVGRAILGERPEEDKRSVYLSAFVGVLVVSILVSIPFIGGLIAFIALLLGLGALTLDWKVRRDAKKQTHASQSSEAKNQDSGPKKATKKPAKKTSKK